MRKVFLALLMVSVMALSFGLIANCSTEKAPLKVALIIAQGGLGDLSYNDLAYSGLQKAARDFAGKIQVRVVQSSDIVTQGESVLRAAAKAGFDLVITLEYSNAGPLARVAPDYPRTKFAILNIVVDQPNVTSVMFGEQEGSFLAGALAGLVTRDTSIPGINSDNVIGVIGGTKSLGIDKFIVGYVEGARYVNPDIKVLVDYSQTFGDPAVGKRLATAMFEKGADIVYQVAGGTGLGIIKAAKETGHYAIGVDTDQDYLAPGHVLTSMIKRSDIAVYTLIKRAIAGSLTGGVITLGLKEGGVGISPMRYTKTLIPTKILDQVNQIKQDILAGKIVPTDITKVKDPSKILQQLGIGG